MPEEEARLTSGINELFSQYSDTAGKEKTSQVGALTALTLNESSKDYAEEKNGDKIGKIFSNA